MAVIPVKGDYKKGDTAADLELTLEDRDDGNAVIDVTGFTVKLLASNLREGVDVAAINAVLTDAVNGIVTWDCVTIAAAEGNYRCNVELTDAGAKVQRMDPFQINVGPKSEDQ